MEKKKCEQQLKILMFCDFIVLCKSPQPALKSDPTNKRRDGENKSAEVTETNSSSKQQILSFYPIDRTSFSVCDVTN